MTKLRVNFGGDDWRVDLSVEEFEQRLSAGSEFITLPLIFFEKPHATVRVRPSQIRYYLEEL